MNHYKFSCIVLFEEFESELKTRFQTSLLRSVLHERIDRD